MKRTRTIRPLTLRFSHHVALACLCGFFMALSALSGVAMAQNPVPLINQPLVPDASKPGGAGFTLTVNGTGFVSSSVVKWNGSARATTFVGKSQLKATILSSDVAKPGTASVTVINPSPGGGRSNAAFFEVTTPTASIALSESELSATCCPSSVVTADFNGDGKLDLALATSSASVLLGNGDGTFQAGVDYAAGANPYVIAVGDFNRDGKIDLVVTNYTSPGTVSVLLNSGFGAFLPSTSFGTGANPIGLVVGDFNRDGKLDLAVANSTSNSISVLLGNGDGTFRSAVDYGTALTPYSVVAGDFNGDGKLDLAVANSGSDTVSVFLGNGDGTFQPAIDYGVGSQPQSLAVADFNGDDKLDLAAANVASNNVSVLLGKGDGAFQGAVNYAVGSSPGSVAVGDLNGDGKVDLVLANGGSNSVSVLFGNGNGTFQSAVSYIGYASPFPEIAVGDFNRDGRLDVAVPGSGGTTFSVQLQTPLVSLSKTKLNFADHLVGTSSEQTVRLTNSGLTLTISSIAITGTNAGDFRQKNNCGSGLPPGAHCTIRVTFEPTKLGPRTAALTITDNAAGSPQSVPLSGTGVTSGPNATLSAKSLTFTTELVGTTSPAQPVTLSNWGTETLNISSIVASGEFSESNNCGSSLPPGGNCTISVTFTPTQRGHQSGTVTITDNAPNSPQKESLTGTGTVVKLDPTTLDFHCHNEPNTCPPPPQRTTLTNTGSTTLTISKITITGQYFSETSKCPARLKPNKSCTITVYFNPQERGTFNGAVSVFDNGGGSPQGVVLSGSETKKGMSLAARSAIGTIQAAAVPSPTGPSPVGTQVMHLIDSTRDDPFLPNGTKRELLVRFWYPASPTQGCEAAEYTAPAVWSHFSQLAKIPLPEVRTNSCLGAPITGGAHPVVVFTHGYTGTFTDYTFIFEDLASRGYVVASVDHTYEATAVEFPEGRFVQGVLGSHLDNSWRLDDNTLLLALSVRVGDLKFVVDKLERLNAVGDDPFAGRLDMSRIALMGHSLGGLAALSGLQQEPRFGAGILLDGELTDESAGGTDKAVLILAMGRRQWSDNECKLWGNLRGARLAVNLKGAEHLTPTDAVWLARGAIRTGTMGADKTIAAMRDYIAAFLDTNLQGKVADRLLTGPAPDYPDAAVTTQRQSLCGEP